MTTSFSIVLPFSRGIVGSGTMPLDTYEDPSLAYTVSTVVTAPQFVLPTLHGNP